MDNRRGGFKGNQGSRDRRGGNNFRRNDGPREMHKVVCSECGVDCEVPFKPSEDRPVYCKNCYGKHKKF